MRARHQSGWVELRGRRWYGHYYTYERDASGKEVRRHRGVVLGEKSKLRKFEAVARLRQIIATAARGVPAGKDLTVGWFVRERFLPMREPRWRQSTRRVTLGNLSLITNEVGDAPLAELDKFRCQLLLNRLAERGYSFSVVDHCRTLLRATLEEALDQELIAKNPARKLANPETKPSLKPILAKESARALFNALPLRDRLIAMIAAFCAMRPGEIFGLQWSSWLGDSFRIQGTVSAGILVRGRAKTEHSLAEVAIPDVILPLLRAWREASGNPTPETLIFPSGRRKPMWPENWLRLNLRPIALRLGITAPVNFQVLRRSFATHAQGLGSPKDVQSHLRHTNIGTTLNIYTQPVADSVRQLVNAVTVDVLGLDPPASRRLQ